MVDDIKQGGEELHEELPKPKSPIAAREEDVLAFWNSHNIFEKSLAKPSPKGEYVFYDGPPFATGLPHYGHLLQSALKDAIPRYRTMQGYHVARRWGWDCHGLPLENQIEAELGIKTKREIEELGVEKFNKAAQNAVLRYADDWKRIIPRFGRWVDMDHDYRTMDASYTESVWWAFKNLYDRKLIYEGFKAMQLCPRCGTTLSNFEVAQGYKDIEDIAVTVKLPLVDEPGTSLLIWTTTPWTLPGNTAAAVNADATYVKVKVGDEFFVVAKDLWEGIFLKKSLTPSGSTPDGAPPPGLLNKNSFPEVVGEIKGKDLVGKRYEPPFDYFKNELHKHKTHAWRVYAAPYVTLEDGTGLVHLAPAFGAEDLALAEKEKIPLIHHVTDEGKFISTVTDFAGLPAKPKGNPKETDAKIVEWLRAHGKLFADEKIKHSYPHCWRCDTPLLNWAANSWFVNVQKIKNKLVAENAHVRWVPEHVGKGRFNNGLMSAPDWAISRSRYWGAPLPVWRHSKTKEIKVIGSVEELLPLVRRSGNRYFVMRHGEARSNVEEFYSSTNDIENHLTQAGVERVRASARELARQGVDIIVASPLDRVQESARLVAEVAGLPSSAIMTDTRLGEVHFGEKNGAPIAEWEALFAVLSDKFNRAAVGGETYAQVHKRVGEFLFDIERRYSGKKILIITHGVPAWLMTEIANRSPIGELHKRTEHGQLFATAQWRKVEFTLYPHNENYQLDLHRPFIDEVPLGDSLSGHWQRVPDVFDCWFESGSMPFASAGYPRDKKEFDPKRVFGLFPKGYPADFIAESIDQTRGWFYSLIVLGTALFGKSPYKAVVTNGLVLAEDGRKMSKKLKNYPDPMEVVEQFGADAVRYYLLSSSVIRGEDLRFSARGVEEVAKKVLMRLDNVKSFFDLYKDKAPKASEKSPYPHPAEDVGTARPRLDFSQKLVGATHILDKWILSRLGELVKAATDGYENYELDAATRPLGEFVDDLSTWYVRRSRDRFKNEGDDKAQALVTLRLVLKTVAQVMAPVMPFYADYLYREMRDDAEEESVHLTGWPAALAVDTQLLADMKQVRALASQALQLREKANMKIRQPLATLTAKKLPSDPALRLIVADEVNVKEVVEDVSLQEDVVLDTELTPELREEGMLRDLMRLIQDWRKEQKMQMSDRPTYTLRVSAETKRVAEKYRSELVSQTGLGDLVIELTDA